MVVGIEPVGESDGNQRPCFFEGNRNPNNPNEIRKQKPVRTPVEWKNADGPLTKANAQVSVIEKRPSMLYNTRCYSTDLQILWESGTV